MSKDVTYRILRTDEIIRTGDEWGPSVNQEWQPVFAGDIGKAVRDVSVPPVRMRRLVEGRKERDH